LDNQITKQNGQPFTKAHLKEAIGMARDYLSKVRYKETARILSVQYCSEKQQLSASNEVRFVGQQSTCY